MLLCRYRAASLWTTRTVFSAAVKGIVTKGEGCQTRRKKYSSNEDSESEKSSNSSSWTQSGTVETSHGHPPIYSDYPTSHPRSYPPWYPTPLPYSDRHHPPPPYAGHGHPPPPYGDCPQYPPMHRHVYYPHCYY